jgi:Fur family transcriptional regulator, stress-responsive regulator
VSDADWLRGAGLRVTAARLAILQVLRAAGHLTTDEITAAVRGQTGHVTLQAIYESLGAMARAGVLRRIEPAGSPARYEVRVGDNHFHIVCRSCGTIADVDCVVGHAPCLEPAESAGFILDEAEVTFWGMCQDCLARSAGA